MDSSENKPEEQPLIWPVEAETTFSGEDDDLEDGTGEEIYRFQVNPQQANLRLDRFLSEQLPSISRSYIQRLIGDGYVARDGQPVTVASTRLRSGTTIELRLPPPAPLDLVPEDIPLNIVYEDQDVLVIDKPAGIVVHPSAGHSGGTLVNAILHHAPDVELNGTQRPGIVHRLDKDTSGLLMIAKTSRAQADLAAQIKNHLVTKQYIALVAGHVAHETGVIDAPIGRDPTNRKRMAIVDEAHIGKPARTYFKVHERIGGGRQPAYTLLNLRLETGRTHQIRVHLAGIGHPIIGDPVYGKPALGLERQFLHAARLAFTLPSTQTEATFESPLPPDLVTALIKAHAT